MTTTTNDPTLILIPGHWLGAWAWDEVMDRLTAVGRSAVPMTLPGLDGSDPERASRTLDDQVSAIELVLDRAGAADGRPVVIHPRLRRPRSNRVTSARLSPPAVVLRDDRRAGVCCACPLRY
jgi:hypothetical protein